MQGEEGSGGGDNMSPPTFSEGLEQDLVQRVGTRLQLRASVEPDNKAGKVSSWFNRWWAPGSSSGSP